MAPDALWSENILIPPGGRINPYSVSPDEYQASVLAGKIHTQIYPVTVTGLLPPFRALQRTFDHKNPNPIQDFFRQAFQDSPISQTLDKGLEWIGLHPYPKVSDLGVYAIPFPNGQRPDYRLGFGLVERDGAVGFTLSCATCHSANLFGKTVLGLTNRFPKANLTFIRAKQIVPYIPVKAFQFYSKATPAEVRLFSDAQKNLNSVGNRQPQQIGLDTSLAQVSLSLAHRNLDAWATKNPNLEKYPRHEVLETTPADSKPAVWWNLKYKNRWLSDGSIISGNPVFTNILWNEIGRGVDLEKLDQWIESNQETVRDLTTAVFSIEAPRITDFFSEEKINLEMAKKGETIFEKTCAGCHGHYDKAWSLPDSERLPVKEQIKTVLVRYKEKTVVKDVGTDPNRYLGMKSLEQLNNLAISKKIGAFIQSQKGYVPPPLVGIWARWPYFHNNSIPNLCALLTPAQQRPVSFFTGEANDPGKDFDFECNGYPLDNKVPLAWKTKAFLYDTRRDGMKNSGHDIGIFIKEGKEILSPADKKNLISFLQTL